MNGNAMREMPKYQCYKEVWALKIKEINPITIEGVYTGSTIIPEDSGYGPFEVDEKYVNKHNPQEGGYFVVYKDGYTSYSPAQAFESGYTLIK